jgi:8-oxo-dGTP pyrophosphatase MutT (NUDIX family)
MSDNGRFMFGVGAVIVHEKTGKVLITKRSDDNPFNAEKWEVVYGRVEQGENVEEALYREVKEELGEIELDIKKILRFWHFYRGEKVPANEIMGLTYLCSTRTENIKLSHEHSAFRWVDLNVAMDLITVDGIREDVRIAATGAESHGIVMTDLSGKHHKV